MGPFGGYTSLSDFQSPYQAGWTGTYGGLAGGQIAAGNPAITGTAATAGSGNIVPSSPYDFSPAYGGKPQVPDPIAIAKTTAEGNLANLGQYEQLASKVNAANYLQMMDQVRKGFPGYDSTMQGIGNMIGAQVHGSVPQDVVNQLTQFGAERGIATGSPGSPNANAALMKAFYDTSINQQQRGMANANTLMGMVPKSPLMDVTKMFTDPNSVYDAQLNANAIAAAPSPYAKAMEDLRRLYAGMNQGMRQTAPSGNVSSAPTGWSPQSQTQDLLNSLIKQYSQGSQNQQPTAPKQDMSGYDMDALIYGYDPAGFWGGTENLGFEDDTSAGGVSDTSSMDYADPSLDMSNYDYSGG